MSELTTTPTFTQDGRKGVSYDWQSLYAEAQAAALERELAEFAPAFAE